jgi:hypothetical protein
MEAKGKTWFASPKVVSPSMTAWPPTTLCGPIFTIRPMTV